MNFIIPPAYEGCLLRSYLQGELALSARLISRLKQRPDGILLDGCRVTVRHLLHQGSTLSLAIDSLVPATPGTIVPTKFPLAILYEDEDILVCNKSENMPTHPSHGHFADTLANAVCALETERGHGEHFVFRPINRLDRNTSGIVLIAKHALAAARLSDAMRQGNIHKAYLAILCGVPSPAYGEILTGIRRREQSIITREVCSVDATGASLAITQYELLCDWEVDAQSSFAHFSRLSLVRAFPLTGRTHQLRLHFAHLSTPILGDDMYGYGPLPEQIQRQALHAYTLNFPHPRSGETIELKAPLPKDMQLLLPQNQKSLLSV